MKLTFITILVGSLLFSQRAAAQATEELLHAKTVENFLVFKADTRKKTIGYFIDKDIETRNIKQVRGKTCFAVAEKADEKQVRLELAYLNPFKYKVSISDTSLTDPAFEAISNFLGTIQNLSSQLTTGGAAGNVLLPTPKKLFKLVFFNNSSNIT